ncbi:MAG: Hsp20/alpha crystallin family protein [FCB group bacterium]|nr:Hsp20/alpha crystallin family protein [FCB group bacterium]
MKDKLLLIIGSLLVLLLAVEGYYLIDLHRKLTDNVSDSGDWSQAITNWKDPFAGFHANDKFNPFEEFQRMQQEMQKVFGRFNSSFTGDPRFTGVFDDFSLSPSLDLEEKDGNYIMKINLPGAKNSKINVTTDGNQLKVEAETNEEDADSTGNFFRRERYTGRFERSVTLPNDADTGKLKTRFEDGVLTITIPKK